MTYWLSIAVGNMSYDSDPYRSRKIEREKVCVRVRARARARARERKSE